MRAQRIPFDQQMELIMECRRSGLSDSQWCLEHDINPGTFYNWVKRHRQKACEDIPPAKDKTLRSNHAPVQEVVRIDPTQMPPQLPAQDLPAGTMPARQAAVSPSGPALEIELNGVTVRMSNDVSPGLLAQTLRILRGMSC